MAKNDTPKVIRLSKNGHTVETTLATEVVELKAAGYQVDTGTKKTSSQSTATSPSSGAGKTN